MWILDLVQNDGEMLWMFMDGVPAVAALWIAGQVHNDSSAKLQTLTKMPDII